MATLFEILDSKDDGKHLAATLHNVREKAAKELARIVDLFPTYTDHTIRHSDDIIETLDNVMPSNVKEGLNKWEIYFLLAAAYVHDIGMVDDLDNVTFGQQWDEFLREFKARNADKYDEDEIGKAARREYVRNVHHERAEQFIEAKAAELGLKATRFPPAEGHFVGRISKGHRVVDLSETTYDDGYFDRTRIRVRLLAAYLRLADELETTGFRTPDEEYKPLAALDERSRLEWEKHRSISGVGIDGRTIKLDGKTNSFEVYIRLLKLQRDIETKLREIRSWVPWKYDDPPNPRIEDTIPYVDVALNVECEGFDPIVVKIDLVDDRVPDLLLGERLYGDRTASIRELIQNAVDTCRMQMQLASQFTAWRPQVTITADRAMNTFTVSDNGMGMSREIIQQFFARLGSSYYGSGAHRKVFEKFEVSPSRFTPISEFGIGFMASFMIAERVVIETRQRDDDPIRLEINSPGAPFLLLRGNRDKAGTDVTLFLKPGMFNGVDVFERVRHFAKYVDVPIKVIDDDHPDGRFVNRVFSELDLDDLLGAADEPFRKHIERIRESGELDAFELEHLDEVTGISLRGLLCPINGPLDGFPGEWNRLGCRIYQEGVFVGRWQQANADFFSYAAFDVNLTGQSRFRLTTDRTRPMANSEEGWNRIREAYCAAVEARSPDSTDLTSSRAWWRRHCDYYGEGLITAPSSLQRAAQANARFCTLSNRGFEHLSPAELDESDVDTYVSTDIFHESLATVGPYLPEKAMLVFHPSRSKWAEHLLLDRQRSSLLNLDKLLRWDIREMKIDSRSVWFFDPGDQKVPAAISSKWFPEMQSTMGHQSWVFNSKHETTRLLLEHCADELPQKSSALVWHWLLTDLPTNFNHNQSERDDLYRILESTLHDEGVLAANVSVPILSQMQTVNLEHGCPFGRW